MSSLLLSLQASDQKLQSFIQQLQKNPSLSRRSNNNSIGKSMSLAINRSDTQQSPSVTLMMTQRKTPAIDHLPSIPSQKLEQ